MFRENALFLYQIYLQQMTKKVHFFYTAIILFCVNFTGFSQTFIGKTSYEFIGDNREYFNSYGFPQTILASRTSQELGIQIDSSQKIMFGGSYMITHGANQFEQKPILTSYYEYEKYKSFRGFSYKIGSFPQNDNYFPKSIYSDSMMYVRPNIQGLFFQTDNIGKRKYNRYSITGIFDWLQQKNYGEQESFLAGYNGFVRFKQFKLKNYYYYRHYAADNIAGYKNVKDNGALGATIGYRYDRFICSDSEICTNFLRLECNVGKLITWLGERPTPTKYAGGLIADAQITYNNIEITGTYYKGDGTLSPLGDPLYRCGNYGRVDIKYTFIDKNNVRAYFSFNTHFIDSDINFSQNISVTAPITYKYGK